MSVIVTKGCEPLFAGFTAAGLNAKQVLQDMASIVQNDGVHLSQREIHDWATSATKKVYEQYSAQLRLISETAQALETMQCNP